MTCQRKSGPQSINKRVPLSVVINEEQRKRQSRLSVLVHTGH